MPAEHTPGRNPSSARAERGFTLVEILVALCIGVLLLAIAIISFRGAKTTTYSKETTSAAASYAQALAQYQADHARHNPTTMVGANATVQRKGPLNLLGAPYMRSVPDGVTAGRIGVTWLNSTSGICGDGSTPPAPAGATRQVGWITICLGTEPAYAVRVSTRANGGAAWNAVDSKSCFVASSGIARSPAC